MSLWCPCRDQDGSDGKIVRSSTLQSLSFILSLYLLYTHLYTHTYIHTIHNTQYAICRYGSYFLTCTTKTCDFFEWDNDRTTGGTIPVIPKGYNAAIGADGSLVDPSIHLDKVQTLIHSYTHTLIHSYTHTLIHSSPRPHSITPSRLKQKDIEWRRARHELNKQWRDTVEKNHAKSFDHRWDKPVL